MSKIYQPRFKHQIFHQPCFPRISRGKGIYTYYTPNPYFKKIRHAQNEPKLTVQQLLEIESCKGYV